jgi:hypothetical protein
MGYPGPCGTALFLVIGRKSVGQMPEIVRTDIIFAWTDKKSCLLAVLSPVERFCVLSSRCVLVLAQLATALMIHATHALLAHDPHTKMEASESSKRWSWVPLVPRNRL